MDGIGRRIAVVGNSGSGKTTLADQLARRLGLVHIELDELMHNPGWVPTPPDEFLAKVRARLETAPEGWVSDGNYRSALGEEVLVRAETVVWLDLPLRVTWPRLWWRTLTRMVTREELYNENRERFRALLSIDHPLWWTLRMSGGRTQQYEEWSDQRWIRLRSRSEVTAFLAEVT